ncbi:MAG TPA: aminopeptidase [Gaiellaceae bacterium]|nr:aminopeptidase [Gaiellaceae bacterium]
MSARPGWCLNLVEAGRLEPGERVLVLVDEPLAEQGAALAAAVAEAGGNPTLELWAGERPLRRPPAGAAAAARRADLCLFLSQAPRGDEADARFELGEAVLAAGGRELYLGFVDAALLDGELSEPAPDLSEAARLVLAQLEGCREVRVRGAAGTDLALRVDGRPWLTDAQPLVAGDFANFPGGEVYVAPHRDGADGVLVADLTVPYTVAGLVDEPVAVRFERGRVTSIEGGRAAELLRDLVERAGAGADVVAELGIGLNPAVHPRGHVMLDEKAAGTAHVAIGRNTGSYGGDNEAAIHVDMIFSGPQVEADGRRIEIA